MPKRYFLYLETTKTRKGENHSINFHLPIAPPITDNPVFEEMRRGNFDRLTATDARSYVANLDRYRYVETMRRRFAEALVEAGLSRTRSRIPSGLEEEIKGTLLDDVLEKIALTSHQRKTVFEYRVETPDQEYLREVYERLKPAILKEHVFEMRKPKA